MTKLYEILKTSKLGAAPDMFTALLAKLAAEEVEKTISGIPPLTFRSSGKPLTSWQIDGNTVQNGTPTPDAPIMPEGCGERTGNLFDLNATDTTNGYVASGFITSTGAVQSSSYYSVSEYIEVSGLSYVNVSGMRPSASGSSAGVAFYDNSKTLIETVDNTYGDLLSKSFTVPVNAVYLRISYNKNYGNTTLVNNVSTALPYEPYGYKIPISSADTTTNIYLGEVQTMRKIRKLVLTGEETIRLQSINEYNIANFYINIASVAKDGLSSHLEKQNTIISQTQTEGFLLSVLGASTTLYMRISTSRASTTTEMQTWLSNQYTNGTPVTFWYTTEDTTTGIVNEPLHKIGNYADTVTEAQAGTDIPTVRGTNTLTVGTTVQPSSMTITYKEG